VTVRELEGMGRNGAKTSEGLERGQQTSGEGLLTCGQSGHGHDVARECRLPP